MSVRAFLLAFGLLGSTPSWASLPLPETPPIQAEMEETGCGDLAMDVYFQAEESELSPEARSLLASLAMAYLSCDVSRVEIESVAVHAVAPDSTPEIAEARARNIATTMNLLFMGRAEVTARVRATEGYGPAEFGPLSRRAEVRLVL